MNNLNKFIVALSTILVAVSIYTLVDIFAYETAESYGVAFTQLFYPIYFPIWQFILAMMTISITFMSFLKYHDKLYSATLGASIPILAHSGFEDILYFLYQLEQIPQNLFYLNHAPLIQFFSPVTATNLVMSSIFWMCIVTLLWVFPFVIPIMISYVKSIFVTPRADMSLDNFIQETTASNHMNNDPEVEIVSIEK